MSKFYMKLYDIFNSIAGYFWKKALQDNDIEKAIEEMKDSRAYNKTKNRWNRLIEKMRKSL